MEHSAPAEATDQLAGSPFVAIPLWLLESEVSDRALRLYGFLQSYLRGRDGTAWPSRASLAKRMSCSVDTVDRAVRDLVEHRALTVKHRAERRLDDNGKELVAWSSNLYSIKADHPDLLTEEAEVAAAPRPGGRNHAARGSRANAAQKLELLEPELKNQNKRARADSSVDADNGDEQSTKDARVAWKVPAVIADAGTLDAAIELCEHWAGRLGERGVRVDGKARSKAWVVPMEAMLRLDGRPPEHVRRVIDWLEDGRDDVARFWQGNVLSPDKLRARWDVMGQQYRRLRTSGRSGAAALIDDIARGQ